MEKAIDSILNYGVLGVVLLAIGVFFWKAWSGVIAPAINKVIDSYLEKAKADTARQDKIAESQVKLNDRMAVFMNVMATHANTEEKRMLEIVNAQDKIAETQQRLVLQKDSVEMIAGELRTVKEKINSTGS